MVPVPFSFARLNALQPAVTHSHRAKSEILSGIGLNGDMEEIIVGPVEENGKDLSSGKKLGDYVNEKGRMDVLKFLKNTRSTSLPCGS